MDEFGDHVPEDLRLLCVFRRHSWTQIFQIFVGFLHLLSDLLHNLRQVMLDVSKQDTRKLGCQVEDTQQVLRHGRVDGVSGEVQLLLLLGRFHCDPVDDVLLRPVLDSDKTETELDILSFDHAFRVGTLVHDIDFRDDTNCTNTLRIKLSSHLETVGGGHIRIGW